MDPQGISIYGEAVPGGTIASCSSWVLRRSKEVFGEEVYDYRSERWLGDTKKVKEMNRTLFEFVMGNFSRIRKTISIVEISM